MNRLRSKMWLAKTFFTIFLTDLFFVLAELYRTAIISTTQDEVASIILYFCIIILSVPLIILVKRIDAFSAEMDRLESKNKEVKNDLNNH